MARTTGTVSLAELIRRGTLKAGEELVLRRRSAPPVEATLQRDGRVRIGSDVFSTPSAAAKSALAARTADGWLRWRVPRLQDRTLAEIREERSA